MERDLGVIINAAARLTREHWPPISPEQQDWLIGVVNEALERLDFANSIQWLSDNQWTRPPELDPLLKLIDYYSLELPNDVPIILALRSWPDKAISNYYRNHGLSSAAQEELANLLRAEEHQSITRNILGFLRATGYENAEIEAFFMSIALDQTRGIQPRIDAIDRLGSKDAAIDTLLALKEDREGGVRQHAFRTLVKRQHRATISRALSTLSNEELRVAEVPIPESSPFDWVADIKIPCAIEDLRTLRRRGLPQSVARIIHHHSNHSEYGQGTRCGGHQGATRGNAR